MSLYRFKIKIPQKELAQTSRKYGPGKIKHMPLAKTLASNYGASHNVWLAMTFLLRGPVSRNPKSRTEKVSCKKMAELRVSKNSKFLPRGR